MSTLRLITVALVSLFATSVWAADVQLPAAAPAASVLELLKDKLPAIAQEHGKSVAELRAIAKRDKSLWMDERGHLFHVCAGVPVEAAGATGNATVAAGPFPADQTFLLHSRTGATKVIYLDFNGHTTSGTAWKNGATFVTPPYDIDGNTNSFSVTEQDRIQYIWQRVAEDFAPFDVDVTTEDPGVEALRKTNSSDANYGVRVCIGGSSADWYGASAGGVAYVGSFNWNSDTPCYAFTAQLGNGHEKYTAEAISHEAGHTLGLYHDGVIGGSAYYEGHANWAPIMGVGYYRELTQWSKGEYLNANNTEDDLAIMQTYGISYLADDHGGGTGNATLLSGTNLNATGLIARNTDQDVFRFQTGAGPVSLTVNGAPRSPNLDVFVGLYDGAGVLLTGTNAATLGATLNTNLPAGVYYLLVDGVGTGNPTTGYSDYASLGQYTLTGTVTDPGTTQQPPVAVMNATPTDGSAPLAVTFTSTGSTDPDGTIQRYEWDFGDGATATGPTANHTYTAPGTYSATLAVWDNDGLADTDGKTITVQAVPVTIYVANIAMTLKTTKSGTAATAAVTIRNSSGAVVPNANVTGTWSGLTTGTSTKLTGSTGLASFTSVRTKNRGTFTFTVTGVTLAGATYNPGQNTETTDSITY
jgi:PKD repeat protein